MNNNKVDQVRQIIVERNALRAEVEELKAEIATLKSSKTPAKNFNKNKTDNNKK